MMRVIRAIYLFEIIMAALIGALFDQWAASAAQRLGKLSERFQKKSP